MRVLRSYGSSAQFLLERQAMYLKDGKLLDLESEPPVKADFSAGPVMRPIMRIAVVCSHPIVDRIPLFQRIANVSDIELLVVFCSRREPGSHADLPAMDFGHVFLRSRHLPVGRPLHVQPEIIGVLNRFAPHVVVTCGFDPTHVCAFLYAWARGAAHVPMTEGGDIAERAPGMLQRFMHRFVHRKSHAFLSASRRGMRFQRDLGAAAERCFVCHPCINTSRYKQPSGAEEKRFDFIFRDRLEPVANPAFAIETAAAVAARLGRKVSLLIIGAGGQELRLRQAAARHADRLHVEFGGAVESERLPDCYRSARVCLLPTRWDRWGSAASEACASGLPVLISPSAGAAGELVRDGENGYVCEPNVNEWAERAAALLEDQLLYRRFSDHSRAIAAGFSFERAAADFITACRRALRLNASDHSKPGRARPRVVVVERQLLQYRVSCYEKLRELLAAEGIELQLLIGTGTPAERMKKDEVTLPWAIQIPTRYLFREKVCWQPFGDYARGADLVIVMHENKLVYNLWLLSLGRPRRLAFWGHGRNMQSEHPDGLRERFKRWTTNKVDWWFAYTDQSAGMVADTGFPRARITVVENSIDTRDMIELCRQARARGSEALRKEFGLKEGPVGLYIGAFYQEKRIDFLLEAARRIRAHIPDFQLLIVGAGPQQAMVEDAAREHSWIRYPGPLHGARKAAALAIADVMLNPGVVGLGVLDSFVGGAPMFTADSGLRSPEIAYLSSGKNGVITPPDLDVYVDAVISTLSDPAALAKLKEGASAMASRYTIENMATRICNGILACLAVE